MTDHSQRARELLEKLIKQIDWAGYQDTQAKEILAKKIESCLREVAEEGQRSAVNACQAANKEPGV